MVGPALHGQPAEDEQSGQQIEGVRAAAGAALLGKLDGRFDRGVASSHHQDAAPVVLLRVQQAIGDLGEILAADALGAWRAAAPVASTTLRASTSPRLVCTRNAPSLPSMPVTLTPSSTEMSAFSSARCQPESRSSLLMRFFASLPRKGRGRLPSSPLSGADSSRSSRPAFPARTRGRTSRPRAGAARSPGPPARRRRSPRRSAIPPGPASPRPAAPPPGAPATPRS